MTPTSARLILALASALGLEASPEDVKQAFLQSAADLRRRIVDRPKELELDYNEFLQLGLPLYDLCKSGDYWSEILTSHCQKENML